MHILFGQEKVFLVPDEKRMRRGEAIQFEIEQQSQTGFATSLCKTAERMIVAGFLSEYRQGVTGQQNGIELHRSHARKETLPVVRTNDVSSRNAIDTWWTCARNGMALHDQTVSINE
jgi:hypothetical protein